MEWEAKTNDTLTSGESKAGYILFSDTRFRHFKLHVHTLIDFLLRLALLYIFVDENICIVTIDR